MAGRSTKLTPEVQEVIVSKVKDGNYYEAACASAGVHVSQFYRWMRRGDREPGPFREFRDEVLKAEAEAETTIVEYWKKQAPDNWQAARDFLARRHPERWAESHKIQVAVEKQLEQELEHLRRKLPPDVFAAVLTAIAEDSAAVD